MAKTMTNVTAEALVVNVVTHHVGKPVATPRAIRPMTHPLTTSVAAGCEL